MTSDDSSTNAAQMDGWLVTSPFDQSTIEVLRTFGSSPVGFIFGVILTPLLNGVETSVITALDLVFLVFFGDSRATADGMIGLADVPGHSIGLLIEAGTLIGQPILTMAVGPLMDALAGVLDWAGPFALLGAAIGLSVIMVVFSSTVRELIEIALDAIPGGGALLN